MKIDKFEKLKIKLETLKLEKNFFALDRVLYYFSFLGNVFLVYFGYFFIKSITDTLPDLFPYQNLFLSVFIALFLIGYELTKRFVIEQFTTFAIKIKKVTKELVFGFLVSMLLVAGSFYLSINGAHRLVDNTKNITTEVDTKVNLKIDSVSSYYDKEIEYYRNQPAYLRADRKYRDSIVAALQSTKDQKIKELEQKVVSKSGVDLQRNKENDAAFVFMTFFLEFIIILGVGFNSFYTIGSYNETKQLLETPKYKQIQIYLALLKVYYQNGKKLKGDQTISANKLIALAKTQKINCSQSDVRNFLVFCSEMDIIKQTNSKKREHAVDYEDAKTVILKDNVL